MTLPFDKEWVEVTLRTVALVGKSSRPRLKFWMGSADYWNKSSAAK